jgi:hypothetical protein
MTEPEKRIDRKTLLKWAAVAGSAYVAPVLTSAATAGTDGPNCAGQPCTPGRKGNRRCRILGGRHCSCIDGHCGKPAAG